MSASDIPERHENGMAMARVLVSYIDDPKRIQRIVRAEYDGSSPLSVSRIEHLRKLHLASQERPEEPPFKAHEGYYPAEASERAARTTKIFLERLRAERELSAWANGQ